MDGQSITLSVEILAALLSVPLGVVTYLLVAYWLNPVIRYRDIKYQISTDLVYYANTIEIGEADQESPIFKLRLERGNVFRRHSAELRAAFHLLPCWHPTKQFDSTEDPLEAAKKLMAHSNLNTVELEQENTKELRKLLKLPF